jgi:bifunctional DNA primase/polymerase-like protein
MTSTPLIDSALAAAERGWHVFPLRPGAKVPALHGYDRCLRTGACQTRHVGWEQRATTDSDRIRSAWSAGPFNIGLACGPSGLVVIDLDTAKPDDQPPEWVADSPGVRDGQDVLAVLAEQLGEQLPADTYTVATRSGGIHLYFTAPGGVRLGNTAGERGRGLGWKIDTRAHGGQVVAAGSIVGGRAYRVLDGRDPAPLPDWLADRLAPAPLPEQTEQAAAERWRISGKPVESTGGATAGGVCRYCGDPLSPEQASRGILNHLRCWQNRGATTEPAALDERCRRYLQAAIHGNTAKVIAARTERNAALYGASVALGQLVAGGALTEAEVTTALLSAAAKHIALGAYSERQAHQTIASGLRNGANRPRQVAA